jgi:hypothetical protein
MVQRLVKEKNWGNGDESNREKKQKKKQGMKIGERRRRKYFSYCGRAIFSW